MWSGATQGLFVLLELSFELLFSSRQQARALQHAFVMSHGKLSVHGINLSLSGLMATSKAFQCAATQKELFYANTSILLLYCYLI